MLAIRNFTKKYSERLILSIPELDLLPGIHWIKGENGSGKSTLFRALAGLTPFQGSVVLNSQYEFKKNSKDYLKRLTYSEAEPLFPDFITPKELFAFVASARNATATETAFFKSAFGIGEYFSSPFGTCSSGMIKKVALSLAFLGNPQVIILDEPFITLDDASQKTLEEIVAERARRKDSIMLLSSHQWHEGNGIPLTSTFVIQNKTLQRT